VPLDKLQCEESRLCCAPHGLPWCSFCPTPPKIDPCLRRHTCVLRFTSYWLAGTQGFLPPAASSRVLQPSEGQCTVGAEAKRRYVRVFCPSSSSTPPPKLYAIPLRSAIDFYLKDSCSSLHVGFCDRGRRRWLRRPSGQEGKSWQSRKQAPNHDHISTFMFGERWRRETSLRHLQNV
jgi:hypothetical protein